MAEPLEDTLKRLKKERDDADRRYNDALTALDRALPRPVELPPAPPQYDEAQITPLNEAWNILPGPGPSGGLKNRIAAPFWRIVAPYFQRQLTFNSRVVDHLNRNAIAHREGHRATERIIDALGSHMAAQAAFHSRLIALLQEITLYVDTKDRDTAGGALVLNASQSAMAEALGKRWESALARLAHLERELTARTDALERSHSEVRTAASVSQQATQVLKRELERRFREGCEGFREGSEGRREGSEGLRAGSGVQPSSVAPSAFAPPLDAYKYVGFEDRFRGSREEIRRRFESYLPLFDGASDVLDVGCGRGEFLDLLGAHGIAARGIDVNHEMAEACRARGLDVTEADAVGYLDSVQDGSLGGLFAAQVVEHLQPAYLLRFLELAFHKLRPGARLVLETLNPACWLAFFESFIRDITHVWPLHPETLEYLVLASGFTSTEVQFRSAIPEHQRLQRIALPAETPRELVELGEAFNGNMEKLNARMFTHMDYAVVSQR
jgi:SAM-dependent methyltransferase